MPKKLDEYTQEELIRYIGELRSESADIRTAFSSFEPPMRRGLLNMVKVFADDPKAGAELFRDLSNSILPVAETPTATDVEAEQEEPTMSDANPSDGAADALQQILDKLQSMEERVVAMEEGQSNWAKAEEDRQIEEATNYIKELGYSPGTDEWNKFVTLASSDIVGGDLDEAHRLFGTLYPAADGAADTETGGADGAATIAEGDGTDSSGGPQFPATAGKGSVGGPRLQESGDGEVDLSKSSVDAAALAYLEGLQNATS